jgi:hypothetical protein
MNETILLAVAKSCPLLEEVRLIGYDCSSKVITELSKHCSKLKEVHLLCRLLTEQCLIALVRSNPGLKSLTTCADDASERFLSELAIHCPKFANLTICEVEMEEDSVRVLLSRCRHLHSLRIEDCHYIPSGEPIPHAHPIVCASLQYLYLGGLNISAQSVDELLTSCPGLTTLEIWDCEEFEDIELLDIGTRCPLLRKLKINDIGCAITDEILLDIVEKCVHLTGIEIPSCQDLTPAGLSAVVRACPKLEALDLHGSRAVTDAFLLALARSGVPLQSLYIDNCTEITDAGVCAVMQGCTALVELGVEGCTRLSHRMVRAIALRYPETPPR